MSIVFAAAADDDTGATDLAGMLADRGMRAVLVLDEPKPEHFAKWIQDVDAVVVGTASRSVSSGLAYDRTRRAIQLLSTLDPSVLQVKYCSTFDSTPEGNIGQSIDAAMDATGERFTIAVPAFPINGRTTYMGYHFVGEQLLSDSPMRHHPLNPMTNSNLVAHLQTQTKQRVGLVTHFDIRQGASRTRERLAELRGNGFGIAVADCTCDEDLRNICEAVSGMRLVSGSSALAMHLPLSWRNTKPIYPKRQRRGRGFLVVAGSCSQATRRQNEWLASEDAAVFTLQALELVQGNIPPLTEAICEGLLSGRTCLLQTSANTSVVHEYFRAQEKTELEAGEFISHNLARLVREVIERVVLEGLILAGGETSSTVSRVLGFSALAVGPNIVPGVPVCVTLSRKPLPVVFKSGNFGPEDFYRVAMNAIRGLEYQDEE